MSKREYRFVSLIFFLLLAGCGDKECAGTYSQIETIVLNEKVKYNQCKKDNAERDSKKSKCRQDFSASSSFFEYKACFESIPYASCFASALIHPEFTDLVNKAESCGSIFNRPPDTFYKSMDEATQLIKVSKIYSESR